MTETVHRLVVRGQVDPRFAYLFDGMKMNTASGTTFISGEVLDQAQLHSYTERLEELGLELLSVQ
jgi:hypothetical protein